MGIACVAGHTRGGKGQNEPRRIKHTSRGMACKDTIVAFFFYIHQMDVKILIGQI